MSYISVGRAAGQILETVGPKVAREVGKQAAQQVGSGMAQKSLGNILKNGGVKAFNTPSYNVTARIQNQFKTLAENVPSSKILEGGLEVGKTAGISFGEGVVKTTLGTLFTLGIETQSKAYNGKSFSQNVSESITNFSNTIEGSKGAVVDTLAEELGIPNDQAEKLVNTVSAELTARGEKHNGNIADYSKAALIDFTTTMIKSAGGGKPPAAILVAASSAAVLGFTATALGAEVKNEIGASGNGLGNIAVQSAVDTMVGGLNRGSQDLQNNLLSLLNSSSQNIGGSAVDTTVAKLNSAITHLQQDLSGEKIGGPSIGTTPFDASSSSEPPSYIIYC